MLEPDQWIRYRANEVRERWDELGVGIEEEIGSEEAGQGQWEGANERE